MSVEPASLDEGSIATTDFPVVLKKILEIPPPNLLDCLHENEKDKLSGDEADCEGVSGLGPSASLTPAIWEKTIPYDGKTFHLEYMDLDEFLMENGISALDEEGQQKSPEMETSLSSSVTLLPASELEHCDEEVLTTVVMSSDSTEDETGVKMLDPVNPEDIEIEVNFQPDPADLVLSSVPGGELFDPRKHRFAEEDLKPQPIIKKAKKIFVPEDLKDDKYWQRRKKNNMAAKRSREARRVKENQIAVRAAFLERENTALRLEVAELRKDLGRCKNSVSRYEAKYGAL